MQNNIRNTNLRFNLDKEQQRRAWEYLQTIYCSKCNTSRQCRHELHGKVLIPSIRCKCQQEIFEQEEAQRKLPEKQMEIEHLKTSGLQDKALYDYSYTDIHSGKPP